MLKYNEYLIEDMSYSIFNIKKVEIYGHYISEKDEVIRKTKNAVKEFLNTNTDVDYLVAYYYPTREDINNNVALCYLKLDEDIKNMDLTDEEFYKKIMWNEYYDFFSDAVKEKTSSDHKLFKEANKMLQMVEEAYFILYNLWMAVNYKNFSELDGFYECLEKWLIRAENIDKYYWKLKFIVNDDFITLVRYMNNIFYHCCIPDIGKNTKGENKRQRIFNHEIANAMDKFEVIHQQLTNSIINYPVKEEHKDNILYFSKKILKKKRR